MDDRDSFTEFVRVRRVAMVRLGWALTGDRQLGEDVAQISLDRLWRHWSRIAAKGDPWAYAQRIVLSVAASWRVRRSSSETPMADVPEGRSPSNGAADDVANRLLVARWLRGLPRGQREVVVLRFVLDLSVDQTAEIMKCAPNTVKSQTSKAIANLRSRTLPERSPQPSKRTT